MKKALAIGAIGLATVLTLTACTAGEMDDRAPTRKSTNSASPTSPAPRPSTSTTPSPTGSATPAAPTTVTPSKPTQSTPAAKPTITPMVAKIPTDCKALVPANSYASIFKGAPLNDPGIVGTPDSEYYTPNGSITPKDSSYPGNPRAEVRDRAELRCIWRDPRADISGISVEIARLKPELKQKFQTDLTELAYTHKPGDGGEVWRQTRTDEQYGVNVTETILFRDNVTISIWQANTPTNNLLGTIVGQVWK